MDPEINELKELVRQSIAISQENNKMLHSMRRGAWLSTAMRFVWVALIIGSLGFSYYYVQPYINRIISAYGSFQELQENARELIKTFTPGGASSTTPQR